jgi:hypothetical protein
MLEMTHITIPFDLLDVKEVLSNEDYVIEVWVSDAGVENEFADRGTNDGSGQDADGGSGGSGRLERTHHESMACMWRVDAGCGYIGRMLRRN